MKNKGFKHLTAENYGQLKDPINEKVEDIAKLHLESFNYMLREGLSTAVKNILPLEFKLGDQDEIITIFLKDASISQPTIAKGNLHATTLRVYPSECRERGVSYCGPLVVQLGWKIDGKNRGTCERLIGNIPIMVKSDACNISGLSPAQLVKCKEEASEFGGYYIINGNEKVARTLIATRRNMPIALKRPTWKTRGKLYTDYGVQIRCVREDQSSTTITLHYLSDGTATLAFSIRKEQFFIPLMLIIKCLVNYTDFTIYKELVQGLEKNSYYTGCILKMLRMVQEENLYNQKAVLKFIGEKFRVKLFAPSWYSSSQVGTFLIENFIFVHLKDPVEKFKLLAHMSQKLFRFAKGECAAESVDSPMMQELLISGHVYLMLLKERLEIWLYTLQTVIKKKAQKKGLTFRIDEASISDAAVDAGDVSRPMLNYLSTGNITSPSGLGLQQLSGMAIVADKLNMMRYISHFRSVHRGAFFTEMRTTAVRKLLPEAWGFLCPVHTPDGTPCGLLNHLAATVEASNETYNMSHLPQVFSNIGMIPYGSPVHLNVAKSYVVLLDGQVLGHVPDAEAKTFADKLRFLKVKNLEKIPKMLEICFVPKTEVASQYPGLYIFSTVSRMMRPVHNLNHDCIEYIGSFEQCYLDVSINQEEIHEGITTHMELNSRTLLSVLASFTPFSDFNQSPRNMYQCQMGKQTLGTPCHAIKHRSDNKLYRLQTPQSPMVRCQSYLDYSMDDYPLGTNAVVAVISYTGYDMEDAMILNKSSYERGFAHGSIYKAEFINLRDVSGDPMSKCIFATDPKKDSVNLDSDGFPFPGTYLKEGDPFYSYLNPQTGVYQVKNYKSSEPAYVDHVKVLSNDSGDGERSRACVVLRLTRNPDIGDKFASRHGQKGICSQKWPVEDMPFTESGMTPDILFNPHGFPSRMTIGMMIESMAGKSAASHGISHDASPFEFDEEHPAVDFFGELLVKAGYNYYGTERMYSGIQGVELEADIFFGVVYYQRLRHMVSDKFQVRTTGPIDIVTHQPIKGRKRAGGIRFGEMERDALIAHGTSFLLNDRLLNCSDKSFAHVCTKCGSLLSPMVDKPPSSLAAASIEEQRTWRCRICCVSDTIEVVSVPYVFRYLCAELAAMNIKVVLDFERPHRKHEP